MKKEYLFFITLICIALLPTLNLSAKEEKWDFKKFDQTLSLTRGTVSPTNSNAFYIKHDEACRFAKTKWGWLDANCGAIDAFLVLTAPNIDTIVIEIPNDDGYVKYEDWESSDKDEKIQEIWDGLKAMYAEQGKRVNKKFDVVRWLVYPTLDKEKNYIYYAFLSDIDGIKQPHIVASVLDREGYVKFQVVTRNLTSSSSDIEFKRAIESALKIYTPNQSKSYADYSTGDKVSEYGIFGVLAALAGIKWGKAAAVGIFATFLIFAKKFWWIILLPFYYLVRKFFKRND
jgi:uncharacterized membrane-anchored protein